MWTLRHAVLPPSSSLLSQIEIVINREFKTAFSLTTSTMTMKRKNCSSQAESKKYSDGPNKRRSNPSSCFLPFSVMSYNCLSQTALDYHRNLYRSVPRERLDWEFRWENLKRELSGCRGDIICLQEVQADHFDQYYHPHMRSEGYDASYMQRTGDKDDGCAIFYNASKFDCVKKRELNLNSGKGCLDRDNVSILLMLQPRFPEAVDSETSPPPPIFIVTTHILFNMKRGDVKLAQLSLILAELDRMIKDHREDRMNGSVSRMNQIGGVILTGDLNLEPGSLLHQFLLSGSLNYRDLESSRLARRSGQTNQGGRKLDEDLLEEAGLTRDCQLPSAPGSAVKDDMQKLEAQGFLNSFSTAQTSNRTESNGQPTSMQDSQEPIRSEFNGQPPLPLSPPPPPSPPPPLPRASPPPSPASSSPTMPSSSPTLPPQSASPPDPSLSRTSQPPPPPPDFQPPRSSLPKMRLPPPVGSVRHGFHFRSAYSHSRLNDQTGRKEWEVSTFHDNSMTNVDFILFDDFEDSYLRFSHVRPLPCVGEAMSIGKLPNDVHGSDHFPLMAYFCLSR